MGADERRYSRLCLLLLAATVVPAQAVELSLHPTVKVSGFASANPTDRVLYPDASTEIALTRLRFDLNAGLAPHLSAQCAYEHSGRFSGDADAGNAGAGILPAAADAPYRVEPLYDDYVDDEQAFCAHELDRALLAWHPEWGDVVVGRQAIGLGRGRLFTAVDLFAPFSPLEIDREWRRGVDALRAEYRLSATTAAEVIGVFGDNADAGALLARVRGYWGKVDAELLAGRRGRDDFAGLTLSAALCDAEVHAECALFSIPEPHPDGQPFGSDRTVMKAVLGSSYTFDVGSGLTLVGEYHYSGFGADDSDRMTELYLTPDYRARYLRGDMQILGRQALGIQLSYPVNDSLATGATAFVSPGDGSGILSPSARWDFSEAGSFTAALHLPWGERSENGTLQSEYGATPASVFAQLSIYL